MARPGLCVSDARGKPRAITPDDVVAAARGKATIRGWTGQLALALDDKHLHRFEQAVASSWCSTSFARDDDAVLRHAYWIYCVAAKRVEVFAGFDDRMGGVAVGACSLSASLRKDPAWCARVAELLAKYQAKRTMLSPDGPTIYGARPRDVEEIVNAILPSALAFPAHAEKSDGDGDRKTENGQTVI